MAWAIYTLLTLPGAWDHAADEVHRVLGDRPPAAGDLDALTYFNGSSTRRFGCTPRG